MVGMRKEAYEENGNRVIAPTEEEICKNVYTISTLSINNTLKDGLLSR